MEMSSVLVLTLLPLLQAQITTPAPELRTPADTAAIISAASDHFQRGSIISVGKVLMPGLSRIRNVDDASLLAIVARIAQSRVDTVTEVSQLPDCPAAPGRRQPRGYRIAFAAIERETAPLPVSSTQKFYYTVTLERRADTTTEWCTQTPWCDSIPRPIQPSPSDGWQPMWITTATA
jgi:hypothetical protein